MLFQPTRATRSPGLHAQGTQGGRRRQDVPANRVRAAGQDPALHYIVKGYRPASAPEAEENLLVDGPFRPVQETGLDRVGKHAGQELAPLHIVGPQELIDVVPLEIAGVR